MKIELNSLGCCSKLQQRQARSILFSFSILIRFDKKYISTCGLNKFLQISPLERYISFAYRLNWYTSLEEIFFKVDRQHDILEKTCIKIFITKHDRTCRLTNLPRITRPEGLKMRYTDDTRPIETRQKVYRCDKSNSPQLLNHFPKSELASNDLHDTPLWKFLKITAQPLATSRPPKQTWSKALGLGATFEPLPKIWIGL